MPILVNQASDVAAAKGSPAATQVRRDVTSARPSWRRRAGSAVGAATSVAMPRVRIALSIASWLGRLKRHRRRTEAQGEQRDRTEAESEPKRRRPGEDVVGLWLDDVTEEGVADHEEVAVEVDAPFRIAGGPGCERNQRDIVGRGVDDVEVGRLAGRPLLQHAVARDERCRHATYGALARR